MTKAPRSYSPLILAWFMLWVTTGVLLWLAFRLHPGHFAYALDDAYIHMALAENLYQHGTFGVSTHTFSPAASSLLWPLLLALSYAISGVNAAAPMVLNLLFAMLLLYAAFAIMRQYTPSRLVQGAGLLMVLYATPLAPLCFTGMEHVLHTLFTLCFAHCATRVLTQTDQRLRSRSVLLLLALAPLLTSARYEGLFLIGSAGLLLLGQRRVRLTFLLGAASVLPLAAFALISTSHGGFVLPNPVLIKGALPDVLTPTALLAYAARWLLQIGKTPDVFSMVIAALGLFVVTKSDRTASIFLGLFIMTFLLHVQFADIGSFYRYEGYLMAFGTVALVIAGAPLLRRLPAPQLRHLTMPRAWAAALLGLLLAAPWLHRAGESLLRTPRATTNIYEQQYQMGRFLALNYSGATIVANDIGAINYVADIRNLDLWGLASTDVARLQLHHRFTTRTIDSLAQAKAARVAVVYASAFDEYGGLPDSWQRAGTWTIPRNVVCAYPTVTFFAIGESRDALARRLREFAPRLPASVQQKGYYTRAPSKGD